MTSQQLTAEGYIMKDKWIEAYMDTAERFAQLSSAKRLKVGAVIVKGHRIISIGYNGTPAGWDNSCEDEFYTYDERDLGFGQWSLDLKTKQYRTLKTKDEVIHAEANAVTKLARDGESGKGAVIFCTHAPCIDCAKLIFGAGINKVFYRDIYKNDDGVKFLEKCDVNIQRYPSEELMNMFCGK